MAHGTDEPPHGTDGTRWRIRTSGLERMYGIGRVLANFYDQCYEMGIAITPDVQRKAQQVALEWLIAQGVVEPMPAPIPTDTPHPLIHPHDPAANE